MGKFNYRSKVLNIKNNNNNHHIPGSSSILIVDDEIDILSVIQQQLQDYGFDICCFTKPNIALEHYKINSNAHKLIVSDLQMPKMNGFEFVRKAKEINSNVKVFMMTCFETNDLELRLLSINSSSSLSSSPLPPPSTKLMIDEFIRKPFSIEKLMILINKHIISESKVQ